MDLHLIESGRHHAWYAAPAFWSAAAHAALVLSLVAASPAPEPTDGDDAARREVVFFLPLLPSAPPREAPVEGLRYNPTGTGGDGGAAPQRESETGTAVREGGGRVPVPVPMDAADAGPPVDGSPVFVASELDREVERDPSSVGPVYPEPLRTTNTEGRVVAEWIVDTTGHADPASFRIVSTTHPLFTAAVRDCLQGMRFRPAELNGQLVRQLVRQEFRFQLQLPRADSTAAGSGAAG